MSGEVEGLLYWWQFTLLINKKNIDTGYKIDKICGLSNRILELYTHTTFPDKLQIRRNLKQSSFYLHTFFFFWPQLYLRSNTSPKRFIFYPHPANSRISSLGRFLEVGKVLMEIVKMVPELNTVLQDILHAGFQSMEFATLTLQTVNGKRESISVKVSTQLTFIFHHHHHHHQS